MDFEEEDFNKLVDLERKQFTWSGLYPLDKPTTLFYNLRALLIYIFSSSLVISMIISLFITFNDLSTITDILYYLITQSAYLCKLTNFVIKRKKILEIEECLKSKILYKYYKTYGKIYMPDVLFNCNSFARVFRITVVVLIFFYAAFPIFDKGSGKNLPFAGWYPVDTDKFHTHIYAFQLACLTVSAFSNSSIDIFTTFLISIAIVCLRMLKNCLRNVDYGNKLVGAISEERLGDLVDLHKQILYLISLIEETFSYGIFVQFMASILVICLTCFQMLVVPPASAEFMMLISYFACMMCQICLYCWFGNEILVEGDGITQACYMSSWYEGSIKSKKVLFLVMERSKRETKLTAGKFFTLSLATLIMIFKSSYSYFAVLQRVYKEE